MYETPRARIRPYSGSPEQYGRLRKTKKHFSRCNNMLDMKFVRENPDVVKENIKKKFQEFKLPLVDEVIALDAENRAAITEASELRAQRNQLSKQVGMLMGQAKRTPPNWKRPKLPKPR